MAGRRTRSTHKHTLKLRWLKPDGQARVLAKLVQLHATLSAAEPDEADLQLVHDEMLWVQREGYLRQESVSRLAELFRQHGVE